MGHAPTSAADTRTLTMRALVPPILFENMLRNLTGTANVFLLSRYSDEAVSAVGVANQYVTMVVMLFSLISTGSVVAMNQALGSGSREKAGRIATVVLAVNAAAGVLFGIIFMIFGGFFLSIMSLAPELIREAQGYLSIAGGLIVFQAVTTALSVINRCYGFTRMPLVVAILVNILNILGNYIVIFRPFETPLSGVTGVAAVLVTSQLCGCVIIAMLTVKNKISIKPSYLKPFPIAELKAALTVGIPAGLDGLNYSIAQIITTAFISGLGAEAVSAKIYVQSIVYYVYILSVSVGQSAQILIGRHTGAGDYAGAEKTAKLCLKICLTSNMSLSALAFIFRHMLISIFTDNPVIISLSVSIFIVDFFVEIARSFNSVYLCSLRGAGDVKISTIINLISMWVVSVGVAWLFGVGFGWGLAGMWAAFGLDEAVRGGLLMLRWKSGRWRDIAALRVKRLAINN